jgi:dienelactone hydrolase
LYRRHNQNAALIAIVATLAAGCVNLGGVQQSWKAAVVEVHSDTGRVFGKLGDTAVKTGLAQIDHDHKFPTIVYFHGCTGLREETDTVMYAGTPDFWRRLKQDGYAVVAPDSFARDNRQPLCGAGWIQDRIRIPEMTYAVEQLKMLSWVDTSNIVLVGFSEGGSAVSQYSGGDVSAVIILGNDCSLGVRFPGPSLAILSANDSWIRKSNPCKGATKRLIIDSDIHNALRFSEAQTLFRQFLRDNKN